MEVSTRFFEEGGDSGKYQETYEIFKRLTDTLPLIKRVIGQL